MLLLRYHMKKKTQVLEQEQELKLSNNKQYKVETMCNSKICTNKIAIKLLNLNYLIF